MSHTLKRILNIVLQTEIYSVVIPLSVYLNPISNGYDPYSVL